MKVSKRIDLTDPLYMTFFIAFLSLSGSTIITILASLFELEGNTISYKIEDGMITLTVVDADGNETIIQLPLGDFSF